MVERFDAAAVLRNQIVAEDVGGLDDSARRVFLDDLGVGQVGVDQEAGFLAIDGLGHANAVGVVLVGLVAGRGAGQ